MLRFVKVFNSVSLWFIIIILYRRDFNKWSIWFAVYILHTPSFRGKLLALVGSAPSLPLLSPPLLTSPLPLEVGPLKSS